MVYVQCSIPALGSFSYAEDDNRHILGVKTAEVVEGGSSGGEGGSEGVRYCCHMLECSSEVSGCGLDLCILYYVVQILYYVVQKFNYYLSNYWY